MSKEGLVAKIWKGKEIKVNILFSMAGIAQHIWVENENGAILFDAGDGILRDIRSSNLKLEKLRSIFIIHGHFDHVGGLHSLLGFLRMIGRKEELSIFAPEGCTEAFYIVENFIECYPATIPFEITLKSIRSQKISKIAGINIEAFPVVHSGGIEGFGVLPEIPAMGYRISYKNEVIAIKGDTGFCPSLENLVKGVDLAIIEATYGCSEGVSEESLNKVHLSEDIAKEIGKLAKDFILVHKGRRNK
ncbi:MBL fold metallo-hydrolase [candidate division WOR-3 bacterium]|nr:MBL fold metallo-hydrolase [candidate division WOR-3 bacterium]